MNRRTIAVAFLLFSAVASTGDSPKRPRIFGIARMQIFTTDISSARSFYSKVLDQTDDCNWCEKLPGRSFAVNWNQGIGLSEAPSPVPPNLIEEIAFATDSVAGLRRYLMANNIPVSKPNKPGDNYLSVADPEGHRIGFLQRPEMPVLTGGQQQSLETVLPSKLHIVHAGFVVRDRAAEDGFYKDVLGFHLYWQGGMKESEDHWVDMQVPDGTDWLEYMLNVASNADKHTLGEMNHIGLGVENIKPTTERLRDDGVVPILEEAKIGRDGKWALDVYDPDGTRIEFMEFTPVRKPCCSEYTGPHPKP